MLRPLVLKFIFADSHFPKPFYHPFSGTYFCNTSKQGFSPSVRWIQPSGARHKSSGVIKVRFSQLPHSMKYEKNHRITITHRHSASVSDRLRELLNCAKVTNKKKVMKTQYVSSSISRNTALHHCSVSLY